MDRRQDGINVEIIEGIEEVEKNESTERQEK